MAIALRQVATATVDRAITLTINKPTGTVQDDIMAACIVVRGHQSYAMAGVPTGWTEIVKDNGTLDNTEVFAYYKVAGASEPANYTWTTTFDIYDIAGGIVSYSGGNTAAPINASAVTTTAASATVNAPSITTTVNGCQLVFFAGIRGANSATPPAGYAEQWDVNSGGDYKACCEMAHVNQATAGVTGAITATAATAADNIGIHIAVAPAAVTFIPRKTDPILQAVNRAAHW